ncbi:MAG TPA: endonuclease III [Caldithrix abyssi]|uniref:Endonuclease III n=1 Tax=Caldithrix abyssi TaxID=187145 RepID=A0A7V4UDG5_CALAY|nr:endonuclease III [Caldithrix abyssi]
MKKDTINISRILDILEQTYNGTGTALKYRSPFQLLISTMLAAQSTDKQVNVITRDLFARYPEARHLAELSTEEIENLIKRVGLYKNKAKNIKLTSRILAEKYNGDIPSTREELMELPGVGRKTANVVLSIAKGVPAIAVDTHVFRVTNRLGLAEANNVLDTEKQLMRNIPKEKWSDAHHWLIWHGRKICKARKPLCEECPAKEECRYYRELNG